MPVDFDFDAVFDADDYLYFYQFSDEADDAEADAIWRLLHLEPDTRVLDLGCGHGRITNRLARRGAALTGLDRSPRFLELARHDAGALKVRVEYAEGDMRSLPFEHGHFDCVISWFTSFGYFTDEENMAVLREAYRVLRPGGRLLIENNNLVELLPRWRPCNVVERGSDLMVDRSEFDPVTGRGVTERTMVRGGKVRRCRYSVRMFIAAELSGWLRQAGFAHVEFCDREGGPLVAGSRRMVTIAQR